jgi:hypothetical protein
VNLLENAEKSVELNKNMLYVCGLSKGRYSGVTGCINLELSENDEGDDQLAEKVIFSRYYY